MPSSTVFICYRRDDSAGYAGRLCDRLVKALGRDRVFRDADGLQPGDNFLQSIRERVSAADVLFVLIGPRWLTAANRDGCRRLDDPHDLVRLEIELGLERNKRVIPIILPGAAMPTEKDLPATMAPLAQCQAVEVREMQFDHDVRHLIAGIRSRRPFDPRRLVRADSLTVVALAILVAGGFVASLFWMRPSFLMTAERARSQLALAGLSYDGEGLATSAENGDIAAVDLFLRAGMDPDEASRDGSPLEVALDNNHLRVARLLIEGGANVDRALQAVARHGDPGLFELLLGMGPSHESRAKALYWAASEGHIDLARRLLDGGADANDQSAGMALGGAAYDGHLDMMELLVDRGADVNAVDRGSGGSGGTALHVATRARQLEAVRLLLKAGANVNVRNKDGITPLMNALEEKDIVFLLIAGRADLNARTDDGVTALMLAAARHLTDMIQPLVNLGADINARSDRGWTPLMYAAGAIDSVDDPETVQALLDKGADSNAQDRDGWTALMFSAKQGLTGAARVLVQSGADRSKTNKESQTALTLARLNFRKQIVALLGTR